MNNDRNGQSQYDPIDPRIQRWNKRFQKRLLNEGTMPVSPSTGTEPLEPVAPQQQAEAAGEYQIEEPIIDPAEEEYGEEDSLQIFYHTDAEDSIELADDTFKLVPDIPQQTGYQPEQPSSNFDMSVGEHYFGGFESGIGWGAVQLGMAAAAMPFSIGTSIPVGLRDWYKTGDPTKLFTSI